MLTQSESTYDPGCFGSVIMFNLATKRCSERCPLRAQCEPAVAINKETLAQILQTGQTLEAKPRNAVLARRARKRIEKDASSPQIEMVIAAPPAPKPVVVPEPDPVVVVAPEPIVEAPAPEPAPTPIAVAAPVTEGPASIVVDEVLIDFATAKVNVKPRERLLAWAKNGIAVREILAGKNPFEPNRDRAFITALVNWLLDKRRIHRSVITTMLMAEFKMTTGTAASHMRIGVEALMHVGVVEEIPGGDIQLRSNE